MLSEALSLAANLAGVVIIVMMLLRFQYLTTLARSAIIGSAFGLFMASKYVEIDRSFEAIVSTIGVGGMMALVAIRHFRAYPPNI